MLSFLKIIGGIILGSVFSCFIYLVRSIILGMDMDIFKDNFKKNVIAYAVIGAIISIIILIYNYLKGSIAIKMIFL